MTEGVGILVDWRANRGDVRIQLALALFRVCHQLRSDGSRCPRAVARLVCMFYLVIVEWTWGIEVPWITRVGPGLVIHHGTGIVVNGAARLGASVQLRQNVCLGARVPGGESPTLGDGVSVGAGALVLGGITIGAGARIGAGAVVLIDVPAGRVAVGNPARVL